ncbi:MAG: hypothetical protein BMS9Abin36_2177 [Gammaproteobacteria bacterium]|nr:MAG: hypothetical protein BMS9Abin36_2177 [Gammaproteobacteria bacterium]
MDMWMKIGSVLLLGLMLIFIFPRMKHAMKHSPKAEKGDWAGVLLPIGAVILFVIVLIMLVR